MTVLDKHYPVTTLSGDYFLDVIETDSGHKTVLAGKSRPIDKFPDDVYSTEGISIETLIQLFDYAMKGNNDKGTKHEIQ